MAELKPCPFCGNASYAITLYCTMQRSKMRRIYVPQVLQPRNGNNCMEQEG